MFDERYKRDRQPALEKQDLAGLGHTGYQYAHMSAFLSSHAGSSYEHGLYRIHSVASMESWTGIVEEAFPDFKDRILCFGCDWLGRMFALDFLRKENDQSLILMLEPRRDML